LHAIICFDATSGLHSERVACGDCQLRDIGDYHQDQHAKSRHCYDRRYDKKCGIEFRHWSITMFCGRSAHGLNAFSTF
jgi:hypothetical protein